MAGNIRVAIVDDDESVAKVLKDIIVDIGYVVSGIAHTYEDALELVEQRGPRDIIFVDLGLNGRPTGVDIARRAVQGGLAVVAMTGGRTLPSELAGAGLLLKPFSTESVKRLLETLRPKDGSTAPLGAAPTAAPK